jgi:hypothetical protein
MSGRSNFPPEADVSYHSSRQTPSTRSPIWMLRVLDLRSYPARHNRLRDAPATQAPLWDHSRASLRATTIGTMTWAVAFFDSDRHFTYKAAVLAASIVPLGWAFDCPLMGWAADQIRLRKPVLIVGTRRHHDHAPPQRLDY